jgi:hypothetical protein
MGKLMYAMVTEMPHDMNNGHDLRIRKHVEYLFT